VAVSQKRSAAMLRQKGLTKNQADRGFSPTNLWEKIQTGFTTYTFNSAEEYIRTFAPIALEEMEAYGIPASITLAQGLLESGAGSSNLVRKSNNHFGIKCHTKWRGPFYHS
jgi:flagellum-specific peptidoglycan hydrolase FlgJ